MITLTPFKNLHEADYEPSFVYEFGGGSECGYMPGLGCGFGYWGVE